MDLKVSKTAAHCELATYQQLNMCPSIYPSFEMSALTCTWNVVNYNKNWREMAIEKRIAKST